MSNSVIDKTAQIGANTKYGNFCVFGADVKIGAGCIIGNNVIIYNETR